MSTIPILNNLYFNKFFLVMLCLYLIYESFMIMLFNDFAINPKLDFVRPMPYDLDVVANVI